MRTKELIITKADKKQALIIITQEDYKRKTEVFIQYTDFVTLNNNPIQCYQ
jgi:hypothetical protein